jgi:hypothetical protein
MGLQVTVNLPNYPEGQELGIAGLGMVKNGESVEVTPEMEQEFLNVQGRTVKTAFEGQEGIKVSGEATIEQPEQPDEQPDEDKDEEQEQQEPQQPQEPQTPSE